MTILLRVGMPRSKSYSSETLAESAMPLFWTRGYADTSMDDLVKATGVSRHGIYDAYGGKHALFLSCLDHYRASVVTPAIGPVETAAAGQSAIESYFEHQITRAETMGLPGPGCLFANTMTELAPRDEDVRLRVKAHNDRLQAAFSHALQHSALRRSDEDIQILARMIAVFAQGLWSASRVTEDAGALRTSVRQFLTLIFERPEND